MYELNTEIFYLFFQCDKFQRWQPHLRTATDVGKCSLEEISSSIISELP